MRGWRCIGRVSDNLVEGRDYDPSDILRFAPSADGVDMRDGHVRARDFNMAACWSAAVALLVEDDYVFVATAIGERAFAS